MKNNPFSYQLKLGSKQKTVIYIAPEDLRGKLSGGHIEALTDASLLSKLYKEVILLYPDENIKKENELYKTISRSKNIKLRAIPRNKNIICKLFLSGKRASFNEIMKLIKSYQKFHIFIACHRNLITHIFLFKEFGIEKIFFKSYGSIFLHNLDNLYAILIAKCFEPLFLKRLISAIIYLLFEHISYILSHRIYITRDIKNVRRNLFGKFFHLLFKRKLIYKCSGPFWYFFNYKNNISILSKENSSRTGNQLIIGCVGDNTFPTAILGLISLIKELDKSNKFMGKEIHIKIAGKYNNNTFKVINNLNLSTKLTVNFLGYIDDIKIFLNTLDGMLLPVSGGSAMPIKAIESMLSFKRPILVTKYISDSCSGFFENSNNIYYNGNDFLRTYTN